MCVCVSIASHRLGKREENREKHYQHFSRHTHTPSPNKIREIRKKVMTPNEKFRTWKQKRNGKFNSIRTKAKRKRKGHTHT